MSNPNFDPLAKPYRWLEYATLGPLLERTRTYHLAALSASRQALILGDGDGRFTARLLQQNRNIQVEAVDLSPAMLTLLSKRSEIAKPRLRTIQADARHHIPHTQPDLVVTHFFLDCLTQPECSALIARSTAQLTPGALWLVSDFRIPTGVLHWPARIYIRLLYLVFRILTGLRVTAVPDYRTPLLHAGFTLQAEHRSLGGLLTTQLWELTQDSLVATPFLE